MRNKDLHVLPKLRDSVGYLYLERGKLEQTQKAVEFFDKDGRVMIPVANLSVLMLGPGTSVTHEAIKTLTDNGCLVNWCGEEGVRFYAQGTGETRKGYRLMRQAELVSDNAKRMEVVRRMYQFRFGEDLADDLTIEQVRGMEGARVRKSYAEASRHFGVPWNGRRYDRQHWGASDTINRAISAANACLNGLCHTAIVSAGYSAGLGFVHTGKQLSFVYDVADLYKTRVTVPLAFKLTAASRNKIESRVRHACRDLFHSERLLGRILGDIDELLNLTKTVTGSADEIAIDFDNDPALPGSLWSPQSILAGKASDTDGGGGAISGGVNYGRDNS